MSHKNIKCQSAVVEHKVQGKWVALSKTLPRDQAQGVLDRLSTEMPKATLRIKPVNVVKIQTRASRLKMDRKTLKSTPGFDMRAFMKTGPGSIS